MKLKPTQINKQARNDTIARNQIAMVTAYYLPSHGGIENHIYGLSKALANQGWKIDILSASRIKTPDYYGKKMHVRYAKSIFSPMENPIAPRMISHIIESNASLIHTHGLYQLTSMMAKTLGSIIRKPVILTIHGLADYKGMSRIIQKTYELLFIRCFPRIDHYIASTRADKDFLQSMGVDESRISIIPNAVDTDYWCPENKTKSVETSSDFLFVGSLIQRKRPAFLVEAFEQFKRHYPNNSRLLIIGDGPERQRLQKMIDEKNIHESVRLLGRISNEELRMLYRNSRMLILPSIAEGLPTVLLEAMACGLVVVSSNLSGIRQVIQHGKNGFMFSSGDMESLLKTMRDISSYSQDRLDKITAYAMNYVREDFSWETVSNKIGLLYKRIIKEHFL